jgi:hypothetical protein
MEASRRFAGPGPAGSPAVPGASTPPTSGRRVVGWVMICFAVAPLAMGARGEGPGYLVAGATIFAIGCGLVLSAGWKTGA